MVSLIIHPFDGLSSWLAASWSKWGEVKTSWVVKTFNYLFRHLRCKVYHRKNEKDQFIKLDECLQILQKSDFFKEHSPKSKKKYKTQLLCSVKSQWFFFFFSASQDVLETVLADWYGPGEWRCWVLYWCDSGDWWYLWRLN